MDVKFQDSKSSKNSILSCDVNKLKESGPIKVEEKNESATAHTSESLTCSWILMAVKCVMWLGGLGLFIHFGFGSVFSDAFRLLSHLRQLERQ